MLKVKMKYTGEIREVSRNEAFGLVDSGKAFYYKPGKKVDYSNKQIKPGNKKGYEIK